VGVNTIRHLAQRGGQMQSFGVTGCMSRHEIEIPGG
jgi:hypothetical protein